MRTSERDRICRRLLVLHFDRSGTYTYIHIYKYTYIFIFRLVVFSSRESNFQMKKIHKLIKQCTAYTHQQQQQKQPNSEHAHIENAIATNQNSIWLGSKELTSAGQSHFVYKHSNVAIRKAKLRTITIHIPTLIKEIESNRTITKSSNKKYQQTVSNLLFAITMYYLIGEYIKFKFMIIINSNNNDNKKV